MVRISREIISVKVIEKIFSSFKSQDTEFFFFFFLVGWFTRRFLLIDFSFCLFAVAGCVSTKFSSPKRERNRVATKLTIYIAIFFSFAVCHWCCCITSFVPTTFYSPYISFHPQAYFVRLISDAPYSPFLCLIFTLLFICLFVVTCYRISVPSSWCQQYGWFAKREIRVSRLRGVWEWREKAFHTITSAPKPIYPHI